MVFGVGNSSSNFQKIPGSSDADRNTNILDGKVKISALIVDDDPVIRRIHKMLLDKSGFEVYAVEDGKQAVDLFLSGAYYDLVMMDLEMPIMDGAQATREIRAMGVDSMIIGVTSRALDSEKQAFMGAGLNGCIEKPLKPSVVTSLRQELIKKING